MTRATRAVRIALFLGLSVVFSSGGLAARAGCEGEMRSDSPLSRAIRDIDSLLPRDESEFRAEVLGRPVGESILAFVAARRQQARALRGLVADRIGDTQREMVLAVADTLDVPLGSRQDRRFLQQALMFAGDALPPPPWRRKQGSPLDQRLTVLEGVIGEARGALVKLSVGLRVKGLVAFDQTIHDLVPAIFGPDAPWDRRIDLVFDGGQAWGLVMGWETRATSAMIKSKRIFERLEQFHEILTTLKNAGRPYPRELHLFFERGGIYEEQAARLEAKGAIVHGKRERPASE